MGSTLSQPSGSRQPSILVNRLAICDSESSRPFATLEFSGESFTIPILDKKRNETVPVTFDTKSLFFNADDVTEDSATAWKTLQDVINMPPESARRLANNNARLTLAYRQSYEFQIYAAAPSCDDSGLIVIHDQRLSLKNNSIKRTALSRVPSTLLFDWTTLEPGLQCKSVLPSQAPGGISTNETFFKITLSPAMVEKQGVLKPPTGGWLERFSVIQRVNRRLEMKLTFSFYISDVNENELLFKASQKQILPQLPNKLTTTSSASSSIKSDSGDSFRIAPIDVKVRNLSDIGRSPGSATREAMSPGHVKGSKSISSFSTTVTSPNSAHVSPSRANIVPGGFASPSVSSFRSEVPMNNSGTSNPSIQAHINMVEIKDVGTPRYEELVDAAARVTPSLNIYAKRAYSDLQNYINSMRACSQKAEDFVRTMLMLADVDEEFKVKSGQLLKTLNDSSNNLCNSLERVCLGFLENTRQATIKVSDAKKKEYDMEEKDFATCLERYLSPNNNINDSKGINDSKMAERRAVHHKKQIEHYGFINELCGSQMKQNVLHIVQEFFRLNLDFHKGVTEDQNYKRTCRVDLKFLTDRCMSSAQIERKALEETLQNINAQIVQLNSMENNSVDNQTSVFNHGGIYTSDDAAVGDSNKVVGYSICDIVSDKEDYDPVTNELIRKRGYMMVANCGSNISSGKNVFNFKKTFCMVERGKLLETRKGIEEVKDLSICTVKDYKGDRKFCFEIIDPSSRKLYQAFDAVDMREWINALRYNIDSALNRPNDGSSTSQCSTNESANISALQQEALGNNVCSDCGQLQPTWASINLGCLICIQCSGIHRELSTTYSKVRSISLDVNNWTAPLMEMMKHLGNKRVNAIFEDNLSALPARPVGNSDAMDTRKQFVIAKYKSRLGVARMTDPQAALSTALKSCSLVGMLCAFACGAQLAYNKDSPAEILAVVLGYINPPKTYEAPRLAAAEWLLSNDIKINDPVIYVENSGEEKRDAVASHARSASPAPSMQPTATKTAPSLPPVASTEKTDTASVEAAKPFPMDRSHSSFSRILKRVEHSNDLGSSRFYNEYSAEVSKISLSSAASVSHLIEAFNKSSVSTPPPALKRNDHVKSASKSNASLTSQQLQSDDSLAVLHIPEHAVLDLKWIDDAADHFGHFERDDKKHAEKFRPRALDVAPGTVVNSAALIPPLAFETHFGNANDTSLSMTMNLSQAVVAPVAPPTPVKTVPIKTTVLHLAAQREDKEAIEYLLAKGANPNALDELGRTYMEVAALAKKA